MKRFVIYEAYLGDGATSQLKADILVFGAGGTLDIVELKKNNPSDSPLLALIELLCYLTQIMKAEGKLLKKVREIEGFETYKLTKIRLHAVCGTQWKGWWIKGAEKPAFISAVDALVAQIAEELGIPISFRLSDDVSEGLLVDSEGK